MLSYVKYIYRAPWNNHLSCITRYSHAYSLGLENIYIYNRYTYSKYKRLFSRHVTLGVFQTADDADLYTNLLFFFFYEAKENMINANFLLF